MKLVVLLLLSIVTMRGYAQNGTLIKSPSGDAYVEISSKKKAGSDTLGHIKKVYLLSLPELRERANAKVITGSLFLATGIACVTTAIVKTRQGTAQFPQGLLLTLGGGLISVPGFILLGLGIHQEIIYRNRKKKEVAMLIRPTANGLAINF